MFNKRLFIFLLPIFYFPKRQQQNSEEKIEWLFIWNGGKDNCKPICLHKHKHIPLKSRTGTPWCCCLLACVCWRVYLTTLCLRFWPIRWGNETLGCEDSILHVSQLVQCIMIIVGSTYFQVSSSSISFTHITYPSISWSDHGESYLWNNVRDFVLLLAPTSDSEDNFRSQIIYGRNSYLLWILMLTFDDTHFSRE